MTAQPQQPDDGSSVRITLRDVHNEVSGLKNSMDEIKAEVKGALAMLVVRTDDAVDDIKDHEARIRILEQKGTPESVLSRLQELEARKAITPAGVWTAVGVLLTAAMVLVATFGIVLR